MKRKCVAFWGGLAAFAGLALGAAGWAQDGGTAPRDAERNPWQFSAGFAYEEGDFGTDVTTKTLYVPFTLKYLGNDFDVGFTIPYLDQESSGSVTAVGGVPVRTRRRGAPQDTVRRSASGLGDMLLKARYFLLDDAGPLSPVPAVSPFYRIKFPTADEDEGLGTGEFDHTFGVEFDKSLNDWFLFAHFQYTVIGDPPGVDLQNAFGSGGGVGRYFLRNLSGSASLVWREALVDGETDPVDLFFDVDWTIVRDLHLAPYASVGLTEGSPDYGFGAGLSYRFGKGWGRRGM